MPRRAAPVEVEEYADEEEDEEEGFEPEEDGEEDEDEDEEVCARACRTAFLHALTTTHALLDGVCAVCAAAPTRSQKERSLSDAADASECRG
jgi:hypothetical protein